VQLAGVDLSQGMVAKAQERGCYDQLAVDELVHYLTAAAAEVQQSGEYYGRSLLAVPVPQAAPCWVQGLGVMLCARVH
jgi:hypothetical protein